MRVNPTACRLIGLGEAMGELRPLSATHCATSVAGDVFNTLAYVRALDAGGWDVGFLSAVGTDPFSARLRERCAELQIAPHLACAEEAALGLYMISTDATGERSFSYWRASAPARRLVELMPEAGRTAVLAADIVLLSGITLAILDEPQREALATLVAAARGRGARLAFDPNYRPRLWDSTERARAWTRRFYALSDIALPGLEDERGLFGTRSAAEVLERDELQDAGEVVIKAGRAGVLARVGSARLHADFVAPPRVVDTTAAGDAFNAGWLVARRAGLEPARCAEFAARTAAAVAGHAGAIVPFEVLPALPGPQENAP
jgi:2-dehydro-3-deoxygluconokinase